MNEHLAALWPAPGAIGPARSVRERSAHYLAVPSTRDPRLLVPSGVPGADRMLLRHGGGRRTRVARAMFRVAHRSGLSSWAPMPRLLVRPDHVGIEQHLSGVLGRPVRIGVLLGPPRANLKPVLQVFDLRGTTLAFAKVATSDVAAPLLVTEAAALRWLAEHPVAGVLTPRVLDLATWDGHLVLVQEALPSAQSGREPSALPVTALAGITCAGGLRRGTLAGSAFWDRVSDVGRASWHGVDVSALERLRDALDASAECSFGAWHGDFGPWNAARGAHDLEVWDWERFDADVPAGLDAAHWRAQVDVGTDPSASWNAMLRDVEAVLDAAGAHSDASVVAACYVLTIWSRYRRDAAVSATPALRARVGWLCRLAEVAVPTVTGARR